MKKPWETNLLINWLSLIMHLHKMVLSEYFKDTNQNIWKMVQVKESDHVIAEKGLWLDIQTKRKIK